MKVLLCEDVEKLGWLGDIVEVKDGYARNYLLPQRLAIVPTEANIKALAEEKARRAEARRLARQQKEQLIASLAGVEVVITAKANPQGHLFGSVAERDIAEQLRIKGFAVSDDMVKMSAHIKEVGSSEVVIRAASDLTATIRVVVLSEDSAVESGQETSAAE